MFLTMHARWHHAHWWIMIFTRKFGYSLTPFMRENPLEVEPFSPRSKSLGSYPTAGPPLWLRSFSLQERPEALLPSTYCLNVTGQAVLAIQTSTFQLWIPISRINVFLIQLGKYPNPTFKSNLLQLLVFLGLVLYHIYPWRAAWLNLKCQPIEVWKVGEIREARGKKNGVEMERESQRKSRCIQAAETIPIDWVACKQRTFVSHISGGRKANWWEPCFLGSHLFPVTPRGGGARKLSGASFIRALILFMRVLPSWPNDLLKAPPPNTISLEARFQHRNFCKDTNIQTVTDYVVAVQGYFVSKQWNPVWKGHKI